MSRDKIVWIVLILLTALVLWLPTPAGLGPQGKLGLGILLFAGGLWVMEPIPLQVTGLIIPISLVLTGVLSAREALSPFSSPVVFLILGSLFMAEALRKHGLTRRLALDLIVRFDGKPKLLLLGIMLVAAFTSMWVFSTAVVAMLLPVCFTIASQVEEEKRGRFVTVLNMGLVVAATLGALSTILGASSNAVASGSLSESQVWTFLDWMKYGAPLSFLFVPLSWLILITTVYPDIEPIEADVVQEDLKGKETISSSEQWILYILSGAIVLWVVGPILEMWVKIPGDFLHSATISLGAASLLFIADIISWQDAKQVNWGIYLIIGAGLSLGKGLHASGVSTWFGTLLDQFIHGLSYPILAGLLILSTALVSNTVNNTTVVAILAPIMADTSTTMTYTSVQMMLPMAFGATFGFILPSASTRTALIYASGEISNEEMMKIGSLITFPLVILTSIYFWVLFALGWL
jgi:sodium-dependent dicarboxylate transporter 2/3/5